jgi:anti-sigma B factor antagonist
MESIMLSLRIQKFEDVTILHCAGRFAFPQAVESEAVILRAFRTPVLVLDFMETVLIDAAGVGVLVSLRTWAKSTGRILKLMNVMPRVEEVLRLTKLYSEFEICSAPEMLELLCLAMRAHEPERFEPTGQSINHVEEADPVRVPT